MTKSMRIRLFATLATAFFALCLAMPYSAWAEELTAGSTTPEDEEQAVEQVAYTKQTTKMKVSNVKDRVVQDGDYAIVSAADSQLLVGVYKAKKSNNAKVKLQAENARLQEAQTWNIKYDFYSGTYIITNNNSNKVLTATGKAKSGVAVVQMTKKSKTDKRQRWLITSTKKGYRITSAFNKKVSLAVGGKAAKSGAAMKVLNTKGVAQQLFWLCDTANWTAEESVIKSGVYTLKSTNEDGLLVTVPKNWAKPDVQLSAGANKNGLNQMFRIAPAKKAAGYYSIQVISSSLYLTNYNGKILQQKYKGLKSQLWKPIVTAQGVAFVDKQGYTLSVNSKGGLVAWKSYSEQAPSQHWVLSPTTTGLTYACERGLQRANKVAATRNGRYRWSSFQKYYITADLTAFEFNIFKRSALGKAWVPYVQQWSIACGKNKCTTEADTIIYQHWEYHGDAKGYRAWYWSTIGGSGSATTAFHSQVCQPYSSTITDHRTKGYISQGCIRLSMEHAKWVYYNMPVGTFVSRYY